MAAAAGLLAGAAYGETFTLNYREDGRVASFALQMDESEVVFKKEPAYAGEEIVRSALYVSPDKKDYVGFAYDEQGRKLYLDLNRNLDLTDDPQGEFEAGVDEWGGAFKNISIPIEKDGRRRDLRFDLEIYGASFAQCEVKSSWESGAVAIGGRTFRMAVVDDGDGAFDSKDRLYLTLAEDKEEDVAPIGMGVPKTLVVDGAAHELSFEWSADGKTLALSVEPSSMAMRELALEGEGIERIVLESSDVSAMFMAPGNRIRLPAGRYNGQVYVRMGEGEEAVSWRAWNVSRRVKDSDKVGTWLVGGPIRSKLTCRAAGAKLEFDQETIGAGGEAYRWNGGAVLGEPKLRVKHADEVVHVGTFEYG